MDKDAEFMAKAITAACRTGHLSCMVKPIA